MAHQRGAHRPHTMPTSGQAGILAYPLAATGTGEDWWHDEGPAASGFVRLIYQGTRPGRSWKVPVGPSGGRVARRTMASVPSVTVCVPRWLLKSVPVKPGSAAFTKMPGRARAYCTVSMVSAALVAG